MELNLAFPPLNYRVTGTLFIAVLSVAHQGHLKGVRGAAAVSARQY